MDLLKLLKQYRTIEQMCSDAHSITLIFTMFFMLFMRSMQMDPRFKCAKTVSDCLRNNFPKWISSSYICANYFKLTNQVVQNICDKKTLGSIVLYKQLLFITV